MDSENCYTVAGFCSFSKKYMGNETKNEAGIAGRNDVRVGAREIAEVLLDTAAVKVSFDPPFTYTSGMKAPIYTDNRVLISHLGARDTVVAGLEREVRAVMQRDGLDEVYLAGTSTAGIPWAAFLAERMNMPMVYVRPKPKEHGAGKQVEGFLPMKKPVIVIEDLVTTGGSSLGTVDALRREGDADVRGIVAIFTYGFASMYEKFSAANMELIALSNFEALLDVAHERGVVTSEQLAKILEYKSDPPSWAQKMGL